MVNINWGYFQVVEYFILNTDNFLEFGEILPDLKESNFFSDSMAYYENSIQQLNSLSGSKYSYGKAYLENLKIEDFQELPFNQFICSLTDVIKAQERESLDHSYLQTEIMPIESEIISFLKRIISTNGTFYKMDVKDNNQDRIGGAGTGIWDIFNAYIGIDKPRKRIYRIELGRD
ncbi:MAG: hypothetical protein QM763_00840 [Agriterribacter sp.]